LADEIAHDSWTRMKYLPADEWLGWRDLTPEALGKLLGALTTNVDLKALTRRRRGPKKPPQKKPN
jgi:hypothetical protein